MDKTFYLEIITPEKQFYVGPASSLVMPAPASRQTARGTRSLSATASPKSCPTM